MPRGRAVLRLPWLRCVGPSRWFSTSSGTANPSRADYVVVGGGIVGLNIAAVLRERLGPSASIAVLEKEPQLGRHGSGRLSGVLHAGFYYSPDSLKARLCRLGNAHLTAYCTRKGLPLLRCGKLVVARGEADLPGLHTLFQRAAANGVEVAEVSPARAAELEPLARTHAAALWSPSTAVADPAAVLAAQAADAAAAGIRIVTGAGVGRLEPPRSDGGGGGAVRVLASTPRGCTLTRWRAP
jgi:L-2-hydroxyglutarate oxidase